MLTLPEAILAVLLASPPWYEDQNESGRVERLTTVATAIADASGQDPKLAALVAMEAIWETRLNRRVHAGECRKDECDPVTHRGTVRHTSITLWQLKQNRMPRDEWLAMVGLELEPTTRAAKESARRLTVGLKRCGSVKGAISMYAIGKCAGYHQVELRFTSYRKIYEGIERRMKP